MTDYRIAGYLERIANSLDELVKMEQEKKSQTFNIYNPPASEPTELTVDRVRQLYEEDMS